MQKYVKIKHRLYVPWGTIAISFCDIEDLPKELHDKYEQDDIENYYKPYKEKEKQVKIEKEILEDLYNEREIISKKFGSLFNFLDFYRTLKEETREIDEKISKQIKSVNKCKEELKDKEDEYFDAQERYYRMKKFLKNHGYQLVNESNNESELITTEFWATDNPEYNKQETYHNKFDKTLKDLEKIQKELNQFF